MMIELTDQEARAFRLFAEAQAWNIKGGSATIHFDAQGTPVMVETHRKTVIHTHKNSLDKDSMVLY